MAGNNIIRTLGRNVLGKVEIFRSANSLFLDVIAAITSRKGHSVPLKQLINQVLFIGADAFVLTIVIALITGVGISYVALDNMSDFGASSEFGLLMIFSIVCELGPFLTAVLVVGRSGSALTVFLANMKITREIDALESMGIDTVEYLVVPGFLGMIISLVALNFYFDFVALTSSVISANIYRGVSILIYVRQIVEALQWSDVAFAILKSVLFGAVTAVVSSYQGLVVENLRIVPRAVYRSVVNSTSIILVINIFLSVVYYVIRSKIS